MTIYLESHFDIAAISELAHRERSAFKPIYGMSKWWARRSSSVFRAILLGLTISPDTNLMDVFYENHQELNPVLKEKVVLDPFMGGGTTIVEGLRLGFNMIGVDLNPLSWFIVKTETTPVEQSKLRKGYSRLRSKVAQKINAMYETRCPCCGEQAETVYTFWVKVALCTKPDCNHFVPLFRDYVIGKRRGLVKVRYNEVVCEHCHTQFDAEWDKATIVHENYEPRGKDGSWVYCNELPSVHCPSCDHSQLLCQQERKKLVKEVSLSALLCPDCWSVFTVRGSVIGEVECPNCRLSFDPHKGNTQRGRFICPEGHESTIADATQALADGQPLPFRIYAIEGYCQHCASKKVRSNQNLQPSLNGIDPHSSCSFCEASNHKFYKRPDSEDLVLYEAATKEWELRKQELPWPQETIKDYEKTNRLIVHNYSHWHQLFNPRQLLALSTILKAICEEPEQSIKESLMAAFLGTLEHQNMLNIYYVPYAQSAGAFGRHDFHPKVMVCEGNPWGGAKGRGTFRMAYQGVESGKQYLTNPYDPQYEKGIRKNRYPGDAYKGVVAKGVEDMLTGEASLILRMQDSRSLDFVPSNSVDFVVTDPPYADSVQYSELADFFYVWLRLALQQDYPELMKPEETPKEPEIVENVSRDKTQKEFHRGLKAVFDECFRVLKPEGYLVFTFHHSKKSQWGDLLEILLQSGFSLVNTYPVSSEGTKSGNLVFHSNQNNIAYDIVHVCKKQSQRDIHKHSMAVEWMLLKKQVEVKVSEHIHALKNGGAHGQKFEAADVRVMLWGECLVAYARHYGHIVDGNSNILSIEDLLKDVTLIGEALLANS